MGVLRILLAISVVGLHSQPILGSPLVGECAVTTFFIVSGFYMALILNGKYGANIRLFFSNRALRLYPTYSAVLAFVLVSEGLRWFVRGEPSGSLALWVHECHMLKASTIALFLLSNATFFGADVINFFKVSPIHGDLIPQGFTLGPSALDFQIVRQTWSLGTEVVFYLLAPWLTRLSIWILVALVAISMVVRAIHLGSLGANPNNWWEAFFLCRLPFFLLGAIAFHWNRLVFQRRWTIGWSGEAAVGAILLLAVLFGPLKLNAGVFYFGVIALSPFLFHFSNCHRWDRLIGDFSYSMYLLHWAILQYMWQIIHRVPHWSFSFLCCLVIMACSAVIWLVIEQPIDRYRQRRVRNTSQPAMPAAPPQRPS